MIDVWKVYLGKCSPYLGFGTPCLLVKSRRFQYWWCVPSWSRKPGAWAGWWGRNTIIVSEELLNVPEPLREYLLSHELGHIRERHYWWVVAGTGISITALVCAWMAGLSWAFLSILICALGCAVWFADAREYQADYIGCGLIGEDKMKAGIQAMGVITGSSDKPQRKKRIARLRKNLR